MIVPIDMEDESSDADVSWDPVEEVRMAGVMILLNLSAELLVSVAFVDDKDAKDAEIIVGEATTRMSRRIHKLDLGPPQFRKAVAVVDDKHMMQLILINGMSNDTEGLDYMSQVFRGQHSQTEIEKMTGLI